MFQTIRPIVVLCLAVWPATRVAAAPPVEPAKAAPGVDAYGDPLPDGAIMRIGSNRLRHGQPVSAAVFSPDGKLLASCSNDNHIRIWDTANGAERARQTATFGLSSGLLSFSPDGALLAVTNRANALAVFETGQLKLLWQNNQLGAQGLAWSADSKRLAASRPDSVVSVHEARTGKLNLECVRQNFRLSAVTFAAEDKEVHAVADDYTVRRMDAATGKLLSTTALPRDIVRSGTLAWPRLTFSTDGKNLAVCDRNCVWYGPIDGEPQRLVTRDSAYSTISVSVSRDGRFVAAGIADGSIAIWGTASGKVLRSFSPSRYPSTAVLAPGALQLASSSMQERVIRIWDLNDNRPIGPEALGGDLTHAILIDGGRTVVTATNLGQIQAWDVATGRIKDRCDNALNLLVLGSPDDKTVRAIDNAQRSTVWEPGKKAETRARTPPIPVSYPYHHPANGEWVVMRGPANDISLRDFDSGKEIKSFRLENRNIGFQSFQMSPDLRWLMAMDNSRTMWIWEVGSARLLPSFGAIQQTQLAAFAANGRLIVAVEPTALVVWETNSGRERLRITRQNTPVRSLGITRDQRLILVGANTGELIVHDGADGKEIKRIAAHNTGIRSIWFPRVGNRFVTASDDGTVLAWDADRLAANLPIKPAPAENVREWMNDLSALNGERAAAAIRSLAAHPEATLKLMRTLAKPPVDETARRITELILQLDHPRFKVREEASKELGKYGIEAKKALQEAIKKAPSEDARVRMENLLKKIDGGAVAAQSLREFRLIETLERIGTPTAREQVEEMAKGPAEYPIVREAKAVLERWPKP